MLVRFKWRRTCDTMDLIPAYSRAKRLKFTVVLRDAIQGARPDDAFFPEDAPLQIVSPGFVHRKRHSSR